MPFIKMVGAEAHWYPNAQERDTPSPCRASLIVAVCRTFVIFCRFLYRSLASETMSPAFKKSPGLSEAIQGAGTPLLGRNKIFSFLPNNGVPAPWIASDNPGDFLNAGLIVSDASDLYRNRQKITNVLQTATINEARQGDGVSRSWAFGYQWASVPTILINGVPASVGVKNVDTGKTFYYAVGDSTITIDSAVTTFTSTFTLSFSGTGQYLTTA